MMPAVHKKALRQQMRQKRRGLNKHARACAAQRLARRIHSHPAYWRCKSIALYLANDGEIDPRPLLRWALKNNKKCYLPVLDPVRHNRLWFCTYTRTTRLRKNRYGISEPCLKNATRRPAWSLDLILMPLVAFDVQGARLGMGGGYYDRTLEFIKQRNSAHKLYGLAYDFQKTRMLTIEDWDIPMNGIFTETAFYPVR